MRQPGHPHVCGDCDVIAIAIRSLAGHPHVCGDCLLSSHLLQVVSGSPPRVWGLLCGDLMLDRPFRVTPTCVGTALLDQ